MINFGKKLDIQTVMSRLFKLLLLSSLLLAAIPLRAQTITNSNYQTVANIKSDGTIQDKSYRTVGHIKKDGTIQDASYRTVGHIKEDGTVQDSNYRTIGHAKDIPKRWAAFYFFFSSF